MLFWEHRVNQRFKMEAVQEAADAAVRHSTTAGLVFTTGDNGLTEWAFYPFELRPTDGQGLGAWATRLMREGQIFTGGHSPCLWSLTASACAE